MQYTNMLLPLTESGVLGVVGIGSGDWLGIGSGVLGVVGIGSGDWLGIGEWSLTGVAVHTCVCVNYVCIYLLLHTITKRQ